MSNCVVSSLDFTTELCEPQNTEEKEKEGNILLSVVVVHKLMCQMVWFDIDMVNITVWRYQKWLYLVFAE